MLKKIVEFFMPSKIVTRRKDAEKAMHDKKKSYVSDGSLIELSNSQMTSIYMYKLSVTFAVIMQFTLLFAGVFQNAWQVGFFAPCAAMIIAVISTRMFWYFSNKCIK